VAAFFISRQWSSVIVVSLPHPLIVLPLLLMVLPLPLLDRCCLCEC